MKTTVVRQIGLVTAMTMLLVIAMAAVGIGALASLHSRYDEYASSTLAQREYVAGIDEDVTDLAVYSLLAVSDPSASGRTEHIDSLEAAAAQVDSGLYALASLQYWQGDLQEGAALDSVKSVLQRFTQASKAASALVATDREEAFARLSEDTMPLWNQLHDTSSVYAEQEKTRSLVQLDSVGRFAERMLLATAILAGLVLIASATSNVLVSRSIRRKLREATRNLGDSISELMAISSQVASAADQTATAANETAVTVEETKQAALLASEKASEVAESGENVTRVAESGRTAMEETMADIERMQRQMGAVAETITRLGEQTQAVDGVIATVNDLAEQSNLLSLNASIEAAKAGDYGRGFTVVAREVKSLAEQSKQAVAQVRAILGDIEKSARAAAQEAQAGREAMDAGREKSHHAGELVQALAESVTTGAKRAGDQILTSSRQQIAGMEQIGQAVESISQAGGQSASGARTVEQEIRRLQELAARLRSLVDASEPHSGAGDTSRERTPRMLRWRTAAGDSR